jgi:hypothetical protein
MELAEQYAAMDAASNVHRRRLLADHLREVIDEIERKGDQIASLYELLEYKDQVVPDQNAEDGGQGQARGYASESDEEEDLPAPPPPSRKAAPSKTKSKPRAEMGTQTSTRHPPSTLRRSA